MRFVIEDENYFGQQSIIPNDFGEGDEEDEDGSQQINLSEYLERAYDRFDPEYKVAYQEEDEGSS